MNVNAAWPAFDGAAWGPTKKSFHPYAQMLGKLRVALSPAQPNWLFTGLTLSARGLTTGAIPWRGTSIQASIDVFTSELLVERSNGNTERIALIPARTVAEIYADFQAALETLGVRCTLSPVPQEVPDTTPLDEDRRPGTYEPAAVQRWFHTVTAIADIFDAWRAHFFGRTAIQVWWGALDLSLTLFSGKHVTAPDDRGYIMKYDLDAELMNVGLFYGDEQTAPFFFGYIFPAPAGAEKLAMAPQGATWSDTLKEWVLPYDTVRSAADPIGDLRAFLDAIYLHGTTVGGWDREALSYAAPKRRIQS